MTSQKNWFEANPKKTLASVIIIGFLIIDFSLAAALKILGVFEPSYVTSSVREAHYRIADPIFHHGLEKNISNYTAEWGKTDYRVDTNSLGFKDSEANQVSLSTNNKRIVLIGDSFTEGVGVEFNKTFAGHLKQHFKKQNIDVLNAAATSYSPIIYYRKIKYLIETVGLKFNSLIVFIDLSDIEDDALGYTFDKDENVISQGAAVNRGAHEATKADDNKKPLSAKEFFTQYTYFLGRLRNLSAYLKTKTRAWDGGLNKRRAMWTLDDKLYNDFAKKGLAASANYMTRLKSLLDTNSIDLTIAVYPWPDQIFNQDKQSKQLTYWQNWASENNVMFIDLFSLFIPADSPEIIIRQNYINGDVHWNAAGHKVIFEHVIKQINP